MTSFNREKLVKALGEVSPALYPSDTIPVWTHFCLENDTIRAHNQVIGIQIPFEVPFEGQVEGRMLLGIIKKTPDSEIKFNVKKKKKDGKSGNYLFINGRDVTLPIRPADAYPWHVPTTNPIFEFKFEKKHSDAWRRALMTCDGFATSPGSMGITVDFSKKGVKCYSTDQHVIQETVISTKKSDYIGTFCLPAMFCKEAVKRVGTNPMITFHEIESEEGGKHINVTLDSEDFCMVGKLNTQQPLDYQKIMKANLQDGTGYMFQIPEIMKSSLEVAQQITERDKKSFFVMLVLDNRFEMWVDGHRGDTYKEFVLEEKHPDASMRMTPGVLGRMVDSNWTQQMSLVEDGDRYCVVLANSDNSHIALVSGNELV